MGDDILDLAGAVARRAGGRAGRRGGGGPDPRPLGQPVRRAAPARRGSWSRLILRAQGRWEAIVATYMAEAPGSAGMSEYAPLLAALVALLVGLAIGKAWERYKLRDGKWIDRRRARQSPHYILGLNFLVANQIDLAIEELSRAASLDADALEVHMILGNLYREKGQVGKAITVHQSLLQRPKLSAARARATCCSASGSTTSAAGSSIARSRPSTRCCGSIRRTSTRSSTCRSCTKSSTSGPRRTTRASGCRKLAGHRLAAAEPGDSRVPRKRDRPRGDAAEGLSPRRSGASRPPSTSTRARCRPI